MSGKTYQRLKMLSLIESTGNKFNGPLVETMTKLFIQQPQEEEKRPSQNRLLKPSLSRFLMEMEERFGRLTLQ